MIRDYLFWLICVGPEAVCLLAIAFVIWRERKKLLAMRKEHQQFIQSLPRQLQEIHRDISEKGYSITYGARTSIFCAACGQTSYHPDDVVNKYCGHCNKFHEG